MLIHFVHSGDAYLPELQAYVAFVRSVGHAAQLHRDSSSVPADATVLWWLCGQVGKASAQRFAGAFQIHEYASASVPPLAWLKDRIKRWRQPQPNYRIYQNDWVRQRLAFADGVPYEFRDMGVAPAFFDAPVLPTEPEFDYVYLGEMRRLRHFLPLFDALARLQLRVLLIGDVPRDLKQRLQRHANLGFAGRVPHSEVPAQLRRAHCGLNLVPDVLPYCQQTSTKLLEYCAAGLPVLSTDYAWVRQFEQRHAARFAYVPARASAESYQALLGVTLRQPPLQVPDLRALAWPTLLERLQVWHKIGLRA